MKLSLPAAGLCLCAGLCLISVLKSPAQEVPVDSVSETLRKGQIVDQNVQKAIEEHLANNDGFQESKQLPEDKQNFPKILALKGGGIVLDWTPGQEARYLMEDLRQGLHALQSAQKPTGFDIIALTGAREYWPKLRDISCAENPNIRYYDLDGYEQFCPAK